jgi:hypothetical protein
MLLDSPARALLSVLRCPSCRAVAWRSETDGIHVDPESTLFDRFSESSLTDSPDRTVMADGVPTGFTVHVEGYGRGAWASRGPQPIRLSYHLPGSRRTAR